MDTRERTQQRQEYTKAKIDDLHLFTLTELEKIVGVSHRTLMRYVAAGTLKAKKIGGRWKVSRRNLEDFVNGE